MFSPQFTIGIGVQCFVMLSQAHSSPSGISQGSIEFVPLQQTHVLGLVVKNYPNNNFVFLLCRMICLCLGI